MSNKEHPLTGSWEIQCCGRVQRVAGNNMHCGGGLARRMPSSPLIADVRGGKQGSQRWYSPYRGERSSFLMRATFSLVGLKKHTACKPHKKY